jgi:hypothetical protein
MNHNFSTPIIPISWGELIDKITILEIKLSKIKSIKANFNVKKELQYLLNIDRIDEALIIIHNYKNNLKEVNLKLWKVEDLIREKEYLQEFDQTFISLARSVYQLNDLRANIKLVINNILNSELVEEKSYKNFHSNQDMKDQNET